MKFAHWNFSWAKSPLYMPQGPRKKYPDTLKLTNIFGWPPEDFGGGMRKNAEKCGKIWGEMRENADRDVSPPLLVSHPQVWYCSGMLFSSYSKGQLITCCHGVPLVWSWCKGAPGDTAIVEPPSIHWSLHIVPETIPLSSRWPATTRSRCLFLRASLFQTILVQKPSIRSHSRIPLLLTSFFWSVFHNNTCFLPRHPLTIKLPSKGWRWLESSQVVLMYTAIQSWFPSFS